MMQLRERLGSLETGYSGKEFRDVVDHVKKEKINDDTLLEQLEKISLRRFREKVPFTLNLPAGNFLAVIATVASLALSFQNQGWILYSSALVLMTSLHPLSHYLTGSLFGIGFTHYYLNGPAKVEPTLRINYSSYLRASPVKRALMHASGVLGTLAAPLIVAFIALNNGASNAAFNLLIFFLLLVVFELLTSTRTGDLMRARREYGYR